MDFKDELVTIAENVQKVYASGKNKGYAEGYEVGKNEGGNTDTSAFWDIYQDNGNRRNYDYAFAGSGWTDELYDPKYPIVAESYVRMFFGNDKITSTKVPLDFSNNNNDSIADACFANCLSLKIIPSLKVGRKTLFEGSFDDCSSLEYIGFLGELWCNIDLSMSEQLTDETIMQIVYVTKDYIHDTDETVQELAWSTNFVTSTNAYEKIYAIEADERFPEEYQGMLLGDVLTEKGWGF